MWTTTTLISETVQYHGNILTVIVVSQFHATCPEPEKILLLIFTSVLRHCQNLNFLYIN